MFCSKCGSKVDDSTGMCPRCDAVQLQNTQQTVNQGAYQNFQESQPREVNQNPYQTQQNQNPYPAQQYQAQYQNAPAVGMAEPGSRIQMMKNIVWSVGGSPLTLIVAILTVTVALLNIASAFMTAGAMPSYVSGMAAMTIVMVLLISLPSILSAIGGFLIFAGSRKRSTSTVGYSLVRGALITVMVFVIIVFTISIGTIIFAMVIGGMAYDRYNSGFGGYYGDLDSTIGNVFGSGMAIMLIVLLVLIAVFVVMVLIYVKMIGNVGIAKNILKEMPIKRNVSIFSVVMLIIGIVFELISLCINAFGGSYMMTMASIGTMGYAAESFMGTIYIIGMVQVVLSIASSVLMVILLLKAHSKLSRFV